MMAKFGTDILPVKFLDKFECGSPGMDQLLHIIQEAPLQQKEQKGKNIERGLTSPPAFVHPYSFIKIQLVILPAYQTRYL